MLTSNRVRGIVLLALVICGAIAVFLTGHKTSEHISPTPKTSSNNVARSASPSLGEDSDASAVISGAVRNRLTQESLPGVELLLRGKAGEAERSETGDDGTYEFRDLPPGEYVLEFYSPSGLVERNPDLTKRTVVVTAGEKAKVDLLLDAGAVYAGLVIDAATQAVVQDVTVIATAEEHSRGYGKTNNEGHFCLMALQGELEYDVVVSSEDYLRYTKKISLPAQGFQSDSISLVRGSVIQGRLLLSNNQPIDTAYGLGSIRISLENETGTEVAGPSSQVPPKDSPPAPGTFRFSLLPTGTYYLKAQCYLVPGSALNGKTFYRDEAVVIRRPGETVEADLALPFEAGGTGSIEGRVVTAEGKPVANASVALKEYPLETRQRTDSEGHFALPNLLEGARFDIIARFAYHDYKEETAGPTQAEVTGVPVGKRNLRIVLPLSGSLAGVAVDKDTGGVLAQATVEVARECIRDETGQFIMPNSMREIAQTDPDGFAVQFLTPGTVTICVSSPGYYAVRVPDIRIESGQTADVGRVLLSKGIPVQFEVYYAKGFSGKLYGINVFTATGGWAEPSIEEREGQENPRVYDVSISPGSYLVTPLVEYEGSPWERSYHNIEVAAASQTGSTQVFKFTIGSDTGEVYGVIENALDYRVEQIYLARQQQWPYAPNEPNVNARFYEDPTATFLMREQRPSETGTFRFEHLPADTYGIHVVYQDPRTGEKRVESTPVTVGDGETSEVSLSLRGGDTS
ncbi:MAG: carboxypeptidase-like regulatory domain-containing protein [Candidatus Hydrogenedentes bacterium]|nr:carboxypeptidase-like regulatory domain-containing protein [Candidatus Hydrogenedentota bacterium]